MKWLRMLVVVLSLASLIAQSAQPAQAARWAYWDSVEAASYQMWLAGWGSLEAACSMVAFWTNGQKSRLLSAGHCAALVKILGVGVSVSRDGKNFSEAKLLATGWVVKGSDFCGFSAANLHEKMSKPWAESLADCANTDAGDWSVWEVQGQLDVVSLGTDRDLKRGDAFYILGYPIGGDSFASSGLVSNVKYRAPQTPWDGYIAADFTALPGNSGSGVFSEDGRIAGILVAGAAGTFQLVTPIDLVWKAMPCLNTSECVYKP